MIMIIVTVLVLVYKSFCNTVFIYGHANKASSVLLLLFLSFFLSFHFKEGVATLDTAHSNSFWEIIFHFTVI